HQPNRRLRLAAEPQTGRREVSALTDARKTLAYDFFRILRAPLKMLLDGVSRREVKQYLVGKQIGARTAIAVLCRQEMVVLKQRMPGSR
ncbi:hypothetical protein LAW23_21550, partial [Escherichia coli]